LWKPVGIHFEAPEGILFRLKSSSDGNDGGKLLGAADALRPTLPDQENETRIPLIDPVPATLGGEIRRVSFESDAGLWTWLTLFCFDEVCPPGSDGRRKVLELWRYVPAIGNVQKVYRHLLFGPFLLYRAREGDHKRVAAVLADSRHVTDDVIAPIASRQVLATNPAVMATASALHFDTAVGTLKRGAGNRSGGSPRRLADILIQFYLTFDLYGMPPATMLQMLPSEINGFRPDLTA
jgi:hypothetical protein